MSRVQLHCQSHRMSPILSFLLFSHLSHHPSAPIVSRLKQFPITAKVGADHDSRMRHAVCREKHAPLQHMRRLSLHVTVWACLDVESVTSLVEMWVESFASMH
jgi:hypothetical protein